jgi:hypothetical protein
MIIPRHSFSGEPAPQSAEWITLEKARRHRYPLDRRRGHRARLARPAFSAAQSCGETLDNVIERYVGRRMCAPHSGAIADIIGS